MTAADSYQMQAIATVYLGATAFKEGEPNLAGTLLGALILGVLKNGMTLMNISYYYQDIAQGVVILLARDHYLPPAQPQKVRRLIYVEDAR